MSNPKDKDQDQGLDLDGVDWDSALAEWEEKSFVPEAAKDRETQSPGALQGTPPPPPVVAKPLYVPPPESKPGSTVVCSSDGQPGMRPTIDRTRMVSDRPCTPGRRLHTPRTTRSMGTPAIEAR